MKSFLKYWLPLLLWLGFIFILSSDWLSAEHTARFLTPLLRWINPDISPQAIAQVHFIVRKAGHVTEYAVLATLFLRAFRLGTRLQMTLTILLMSAWIASVVFAATDEFHQSFVPSRTASVGDIMFDAVGALLGLLVSMLWTRRKRGGISQT